jgi:ATPase family associated with various cellular activities (AAA)
MTSNAWQIANQQYLAAHLARVHQALAVRSAVSDNFAAKPELDTAIQAAADRLPAPASLDILCSALGLSHFERDLLLFCTGMELEADWAVRDATLGGALAIFPEAHWSALLPTSPLRYWRLIEVLPGDHLTRCTIRIDEPILHYLGGMVYWDDRLQGLIDPVPLPDSLPPSQQALVAQIGQAWQQDGSVALQLCGEPGGDKAAIAAAACAQLGMGLDVMRSADIPTQLSEREALIRLWERTAILTNRALLLDCEGPDVTTMATQMAPVIRFAEHLQTPLIIAVREPLRSRRRTLVPFTVPAPSATEQQVLWQQALGPLAAELNGHLEPLVMQFNLGWSNIQAASAQVRQHQQPGAALEDILWQACRVQARSGLDDLAQRIEPAATWADLVLPEFQRQTLQEISAHVRHRHQVYETWGFAQKGARGLGISALFAGMSGTGKTMAAEVLAQELKLDLYRIDLSSVVSKYIGETEKNLRQVFDAAEVGGAILLFDEADALFGKRSEVKDSHDRHANIEVSYLLQRMEAYRGLAILTTNLKSALDSAFLRRIRFVVQFPFPAAEQRAEIWQRVFPSQLPTDGLDTRKLAQLNVTGGNIRNIALNAAFLAADQGELVQMKHLLRAAQAEYTKLEKNLSDVETRGWV